MTSIDGPPDWQTIKSQHHSRLATVACRRPPDGHLRAGEAVKCPHLTSDACSLCRDFHDRCRRLDILAGHVADAANELASRPRLQESLYRVAQQLTALSVTPIGIQE